jgi:hypothetical protein
MDMALGVNLRTAVERVTVANSLTRDVCNWYLLELVHASPAV